jgi:hypothetical protein
MLMYSLSSIPYYDSIKQEYQNILMLNKMPTGPLSSITRSVTLNKLSPFESNTNTCPRPKCVIGIKSINCHNKLMCIDDLPELFEYLLNNGYTIDTSITKILQKTKVKMWGELICMIQN